MPFNSTTSFLPWVQLSRLVAQIGFFSSSFFCYIFISLTLYGMKKRFGSYTYLLVTFSTVGIVFASIEFLLYPNVHSYNAGYFFYSTSHPFGLEKNSITWCLAAYTGIYASTISMLSVQFVYRYWAIFYQQKLRMFKGPWVILWIFYCSFFGVQWALGIYYLDEADEFAKDYLREVMEEKYNLNIDETAGAAVVAYSADGSLRYRNLFGLFNMSSIMTVQYAVIIYCAVMMYEYMEEKLKMLSETKRNLHKQFFKTLILQITAPSICLFSPVILIIYLPLFDIEVSLPTGVFLCAFTLYPAMDVIIIMSIVTDYRKTARKLIRKILEGLLAWFKFSQDEDVTRTSTANEILSL